MRGQATPPDWFKFFFGLTFLLVLLIGAVSIYMMASGHQVPCSMWSNSPIYQTPARCLP